jgi:hypothetical protein
MRLITIDSEKWTHTLFGIIIILFISSFLLPFVIIFWLQDLLFHSKSHWLFTAPSSAYVSFFIGMLLIPTALSIHLFIKSKYAAKWIGWVTGLLMLASIPFWCLGVTDYYYFDDEGIYYNKLLSLEETEYRWDDMKELKEVWVLDNGVSRLAEYVLITKDNTELNVTADFRQSEIKFRTYDILEKHQVKITNNHLELYED